MDQWLTIFGNLGIGGGLAFFFAWYLVRMAMPALMRENAEQRKEFLRHLVQQRSEFTAALTGLKDSNERVAARLMAELAGMAGEVRGCLATGTSCRSKAGGE
jgi:hypothetical protein